MRKVLITAADFKPFEREYVKARPELRLAVSTDDRVIDDLIESAIESYEERTGNVLRSSEWDLYLDEFPDIIETPAPLVSVASITYLDSSGASQALAETVYTTDITNPLCGRIALKYGQTWPTTCDQINGVVVRLVAGYATANDIPRTIKDFLLRKMQVIYYGGDLSELDWAKLANYTRIPV